MPSSEPAVGRSPSDGDRWPAQSMATPAFVGEAEGTVATVNAGSPTKMREEPTKDRLRLEVIAPAQIA